MGRFSDFSMPPLMNGPRARWVLSLLLLVGVAGMIAGVAIGAAIHMPKVESMADYTPGQITQLFDRQGAVFSTYAREKRILIREGQVPELLQQAILAAEDSNFFEHGGIDAEGVFRAVVQNLRQGRLAMGGSTITMQLARQLYLNPQKTWRRKIEEALLAVELEKSFSKQQILTLYCNIIFLGHGNYGFEAAARSYFDKSVDQLAISEAAVLAGIPQLPSVYSPYRRPDLVTTRRDYVLRRMREEGFITSAEYEFAISRPLLVARPQLKEQVAPYFAEEARRYLERRYGTRGLLDRGLQAVTTLDPAIQRAAEDALRAGLVSLDRSKGWRGPTAQLDAPAADTTTLPSWEEASFQEGTWIEGLVLAAGDRTASVRVGRREFTLDPAGIAWTGRSQPSQLLAPGDVAWFEVLSPLEGEEVPTRVSLQQEPELEGAVIVLESATGAIRAMVGGWSFTRSSFNRATQARRQVGSAFKPFVYGAALEAGFTPADTLFDAPVVFPSGSGDLTYSPRNNSRRYYGITTLRRALEDSMNVTAVKLGDLVGMDRVIDFARRCGISADLAPYPSLALGAAELVPLELAAAYAAVANHGVYVEPFFIQTVTDPDGSTLEDHRAQAHKAMSPEVAAVLTHMLEGVVDRGTAASIGFLESDLAGKTGTTDRYADAWFVGFTPTLAILSWVGHDQNRPIGRRMTGAAAALPIWRLVVERGLEEGWIARNDRFSTPPSVVQLSVDHLSGLLPGASGARPIMETFIAGTEPSKTLSEDWSRVMRLPWYQQAAFYVPKARERMPSAVADWSVVQEVWAED